MKALLIEDSPEIVNGVSLTFKLRWPEATVISAGEGSKGVEMVEKEAPDIVILDINLPDITGFDVLRQIRLFSDVPIIILTVRGDEIDQLRGLEMGADDYITKPFSPANLLGRVKAVLRRTDTRTIEEEKLPPLTIGNITLNFADHQVFVNGRQIHLTPTEGKVLSCLAHNCGKMLTQEAIMQQVWGSEAKYIDDSTLKRYIYQLRAKLGDNSENPQLIFNERGLGYKLIKPENKTDQ